MTGVTTTMVTDARVRSTGVRRYRRGRPHRRSRGVVSGVRGVRARDVFDSRDARAIGERGQVREDDERARQI